VSTSIQTAVVSSASDEARPQSLDQQLCDAALAASSTLTPDNWLGRHPFPGGEIVFADAKLARAYLAAATHAAQVNRDPVGAIGLLDASIRLDYIGTLNDGDNLLQRIEAFAALGRDEPRRSVLLYHLGIIFTRLKLWSEAGAAYRAAAELDPLFAWHLNNFAWMAATAVDPRAHAGALAVALAERTCVVSGWGCWCFLGTLAAAYARANDFGRAVAWQQIVVKLLSAGPQRDKETTRLREFKAGRAFVEHEPSPVAGQDTSDAELGQLDVQELLKQAQKLIGSPPTSVH